LPLAALDRQASVTLEHTTVRRLIAFDGDTFDKLKQLARDRMATLPELADRS
jgi:hypothetical protein